MPKFKQDSVSKTGSGSRRALWPVITGAFAVCVLALTGCSAPTPNAPGPGSATSDAPSPPTGAPADSYPAVDDVLRELGPAPKPASFSEEQVEEARRAQVEGEWENVLERFPDAQRPDVAFIRYLADDERAQVMVDCLVDRGVDAELSLSGNEVSSSSPPEQEQADAVSHFECRVQFPVRPWPPLTAEQLGYLFDYLEGFTAPCLEAHGNPQPAAPTREFFIENWPQQNWFPGPSLEIMGTPEGSAIEQACPVTPPGFN